MKKRITFTLSLLGCALLGAASALSITACSKQNDNNINLSIYTAYVEYRNNGGTKGYSEWVKDGSIPKPKDIDKAIYEKGGKGADVVSAEIDKDGNLVLVLSNGKTVKTALPKVKWHTVNFYLDDLLLGKKQVVHGNKLEIPKIDFEYKDHWYLDKEFKEYWGDSSSVEKCFNLYAKIDPSKKFKVTLIDEELKHSFSPLTVSYRAPYELPKPFDMNSEYDFSGWEMQNEKKEIVDQKGNWKLPKDITLKAKWEKKTGIKVNKDGLCEFGLYPQSKVNDSSLHNRIANSSTKSRKGNPVVDGYEYFYVDYTGSYYRFEPVKWVLLNDGDNGKNGYRLVTRDAIDASPINSNDAVMEFKQTPLYQWMNNGMRQGYLSLGSLENSLVRKMDPNGASNDMFTLLEKRDHVENKVPKAYQQCLPTDYALKKGMHSYEKAHKLADWWTCSRVTNTSDNKNWFWSFYFASHNTRCDQNLGIRPVIRVASIEMEK